MTYNEMRQIAARLAGGKWTDADTYREEQNHLEEYRREGTLKNLVDAAIIATIRAELAHRQAHELLVAYQEKSKQQVETILGDRVQKFLKYEDIPFPEGHNAPPADPWKETWKVWKDK